MLEITLQLDSVLVALAPWEVPSDVSVTLRVEVAATDAVRVRLATVPGDGLNSVHKL